jgi:hypothetical protein
MEASVGDAPEQVTHGADLEGGVHGEPQTIAPRCSGLTAPRSVMRRSPRKATFEP